MIGNELEGVFPPNSLKVKILTKLEGGIPFIAKVRAHLVMDNDTENQPGEDCDWIKLDDNIDA